MVPSLKCGVGGLAPCRSGWLPAPVSSAGWLPAKTGWKPVLLCSRVPALTLAVAMFLQAAFAADKSDKKEPKKPEPPRVIVTLPLAVAAGKTNSVRVRGENLTNVTELRFTDAAVKAVVTLRGQTTVDVPKGGDAKKFGDSQLDVDLYFPADAALGTNYLTVSSPLGQSLPYPLIVLSADELIEEREPNGGFKLAQPLVPGKTLLGALKEAADVDVFRFEGRAGQQAVIEVCAARHGAPLDPLLTLYDAVGHILAVSDDSNGSPDSRLKFRLPADGSYLVSVIDSFDRGGPAYVYLLSVRVEK